MNIDLDDFRRIINSEIEAFNSPIVIVGKVRHHFYPNNKRRYNAAVRRNSDVYKQGNRLFAKDLAGQYVGLNDHIEVIQFISDEHTTNESDNHSDSNFPVYVSL